MTVLFFLCQDLWMIICITLKLYIMIPCGIESQSVMLQMKLIAGFWNIIHTGGQYFASDLFF